jgi:hypothetical protein
VDELWEDPLRNRTASLGSPGDDGRIRCRRGKDLIDSDHIVAQLPKELHGSGRDVEVSQQSHGAVSFARWPARLRI